MVPYSGGVRGSCVVAKALISTWGRGGAEWEGRWMNRVGEGAREGGRKRKGRRGRGGGRKGDGRRWTEGR